MHIARSVRLAGLLILSVACSDPSSSTTSHRTPAAYATGVVRDSTGAPLPYTSILWHVAPAPDSGDVAIDPTGAHGYLRADGAGRFTIPLGFYSIPALTSVQLIAGNGNCSPFVQDTLLKLGATLTGATDTAWHADITLHRSLPPSRWTPGPVCAELVDTAPTGSLATFQLWIDSMSAVGTTWGRFRINYVASMGDDFGTWVGTRSGDSLIATMTHASPWGTCSQYRLAIGLQPDSSFERGSYASVGCPVYTWPLEFIPEERLNW